MRSQLLVVSALSAALISTSAYALSGKARVVDGDTLKIGHEYVRILGIDAPEKQQTCWSPEEWPCGVKSKQALKNLIGDSDVVCDGDSHDRYGRLITACSVDGKDIGEFMVSNGWAVAYTKYSNRYLMEEAYAKLKKVGIWSGWFVYPEEFRRRK